MTNIAQHTQNKNSFSLKKEPSALAKSRNNQVVAVSIKNRMLHSISEDHPMTAIIKKTFYCNKVKKRLDDGRYISRYCSSNFCMTCNKIRSSIFISKYSDAIMAMEDAQFVTLTLLKCADTHTRAQAKYMYSIWRKILRSTRTPKFRKEIGHFKGIRKLEATLPKGDRTHVHYHFIVDGKAQAEHIVAKWLKFTGNLTSERAQNIKKADQGTIKELAKYTAKASSKFEGRVNYRRYTNLCYALKGFRSFQPFGGFKGDSGVDEDDLAAAEADVIDEDLKSQAMERELVDDYFVWENSVHDWVGVETGELFCSEELCPVIRRNWIEPPPDD